VLPGLAAMKASLGCKYTAAEALQTLNKLYVMMHDNTPGDPMPMLVSVRAGTGVTFNEHGVVDA
jgi:hypothetical protein